MKTFPIVILMFTFGLSHFNCYAQSDQIFSTKLNDLTLNTPFVDGLLSKEYPRFNNNSKAIQLKDTTLRKHNNLYRQNYALKISPWHLVQTDIRFACEKLIQENLAIELELGLQNFNRKRIVNDVIYDIPMLYNAIFRLKYFAKHQNTSSSSSNSLHGQYIAPFINAGTSSESFIVTAINPEALQLSHEYMVVGLDFGTQIAISYFNFDAFFGIGFTSTNFEELEPEPIANGVYIVHNRDRTIFFHNSHFAYHNFAFRLGARIGFHPPK